MIGIVTFKHPGLRSVSNSAVGLDNTETINLMKAAIEEYHAVGISAPQIGKSIRIIAFKHKGKVVVGINPHITYFSAAQTESTEGCLSIPGLVGLVKRSKTITLEAVDEKGRDFTKTYSGLTACIIQHEIDHLNGILFTDRAYNLKWEG